MDEYLAFSDANEFTEEFRHLLARCSDERIRVSDSQYGEVDQGALDFGRFLRDLRTGKSWSQAQLAKEADIPEATLFALEHGIITSTNINPNILFALARALDEEIEDFALILGREIPHPGLKGVPAHAHNTGKDLVSYFGSKLGAVVFLILVGLSLMTLGLLTTRVFSLGNGTESGYISNVSTRSSTGTLGYYLNESQPPASPPTTALQISLALILLLLFMWYAIVKHNLLTKLIKFNRQIPQLRALEFIAVVAFILSLITLFRCYYFEHCIPLSNRLRYGEFSLYETWTASLIIMAILVIVVRGSRWLLSRITSHQLERAFIYTIVLFLFGVLSSNFAEVHAWEHAQENTYRYAAGHAITFQRVSTHLLLTQKVGVETHALWTVDADGQVHVPIGKPNPINPLNISYTYDAMGNLVSHQIDDTRMASTYTLTYDEFDRIASIHYPTGAKYVYEYDDRGFLVAVTDPSNSTNTLLRNEQGYLLALADSSGATTTYQFDEAGRLISQTDPFNAITTYHYDRRGNLVSQTDPFGITTTYQYDGYERLVAITNTLRATWTYTYDGNGNLITSIEPSGAITTYRYDEKEQLIAKFTQGGLITYYEYDSQGRLSAITVFIGAMISLLTPIHVIASEPSNINGKRLVFMFGNKRLSLNKLNFILRTTNISEEQNIKINLVDWNTNYRYGSIRVRQETRLINVPNSIPSQLKLANFEVWSIVLAENVLTLSLFSFIFLTVLREGRLISAFRGNHYKNNYIQKTGM